MAALDQIRERVESLYKFRDEYFKMHDISEAAQKAERVQKEIDETVKLIESVRDQVPAEGRGEMYLLQGRALNASSEHSAAAEEALGRATRFNLPDAWNELGECQYKKGDFSSALTCFEKALRLAEKKVYFRNMSMLMRSLPWKSPKEREENVSKGLEYARKALQQDMGDGHSWLVLGNAYLAAFFTVEAKMESLKHCKAAYSKATNDPLAVVLPELHFSKFHVQWYEEDYTGALKSLLRAYELEPTWEECKSKFDECHRFLQKLAVMVRNKGQLNQRRLNALMADIQPNQLGPYEKGGSSLTGSAKLDLTPLALLAEGSNQDKVVLGKVVCTVIPESGIPFSMCLVDRDGSCIAVTVYNWASWCGVKIGDSVAVLAPVLKSHSISVPGHETLSFRSLRVAVPLMLVVNKRPITASQIATSQIVSQQKPE
ncbi:tetratricopeptide repeat protein 5-like [Eriocheir sinensis]|uniref:tetratricopeptide repeat protein 5-like n=1 Tax=Eriocheir sinensis TaxID=95602 RepID=UPI0021C60606|nr:tetratricopeptide repeat protein 5-like [Eriocheir sinensis]